MIQPAALGRLRSIQTVLIRRGLDELIDLSRLPLPARSWIQVQRLIRKSPAQTPRGVRIREALEDLGPIFVKFGQTLSTRRDLLPDDVAAELVKLQDRVPPFDSADAIATIETALGQPLDRLFLDFEAQPLASASVAQVHAATLKTGDAVVVKVLRPGIEQRIRTDLNLLKTLAQLVLKVWPETRRLRPLEVVDEFEKTLLDELDLIREAANAADIRRRFMDSEVLKIPRVYFDLTRQNVMVMERVSGIPIGDLSQLKAAGVNLKTLAERGVEIFFTQVLRDGIFHADMHPGNIFATLDARYIAIDFGIVGSLSNEDKLYIAENFRAFFNRDYRRVAELYIESGWIPRTTRVGEFEAAIRSVCEPIFEKPLKEISYGHLLLRLFQVARRFSMEVQPQLVLLQKTLLNIEGLGRDLYPDLDLWQTAKPFIEQWFRDEMGPKAGFNQLRDELPKWAQHWADVPMLTHKILTDTAQGRLKVDTQIEQLYPLLTQRQTASKRLQRTLTGASCLVAGAILTLTPSLFSIGLGVGGFGILILLVALIQST